MKDVIAFADFSEGGGGGGTPRPEQQQPPLSPIEAQPGNFGNLPFGCALIMPALLSMPSGYACRCCLRKSFTQRYKKGQRMVFPILELLASFHRLGERPLLACTIPIALKSIMCA